MTEQNKTSNPYINARREWDERYGDVIARAGMWQKVAIGSMVVAALAVGGVSYIGSQSKIQPFVVTLDTMGAPVAIAKPIASGQEVNQRIMISQVANWVWNARTVLADPDAQKILIDRVYAMSNSETAKYLNEHYAANSPFSMDGSTVRVTINNLLPISKDTYEVSWTESKAMPGKTAVTSKHKASITTAVDPKMAEKPNVAINNPLGLFVKSLTWAQAVQ